MKYLIDFMKVNRQGILMEEARKRIGYKMKLDEKIKVLMELAKENDFEVSSFELEQDMKNEDAKAFEAEIQTAAKLGMNVEHNVRDYEWLFS